jgi:hypothetical protein
MSRYDHLVFFPFRNRVEEFYDLLRPKLSFYNMLVLTSCTISWMVTIFLASLLSATYSNIATIELGVFIAVTIAISLISSILNWASINRLHNLYIINIKGAFKVYYNSEFVTHGEQDQQEYQPEDQDEQDLLFGTGPKQVNPNYEEDLNTPGGHGIQNRDQDLSVKGEDMVHSTRQLLGQEIEKSDNNDDAKSGVPDEVSHIKARKAIKDIFGMQVNINGIDDADFEQKYVFIEDKHNIGDEEMLNNEGTKGENQTNVMTFMVMFLLIACSAAVCCYLNYQFDTLLAKYVFYMFVGAFLGDILVFRMVLVLLATVFTYFKGKKSGYTKVEYRSSKEIKQMHLATTNLMTLKKKSKLAGSVGSLFQKTLNIPAIPARNMKTDRSDDNMLITENQFT